jgi:hypothetical protein
MITRAEAKKRGLTKYDTGKPCPHGHVCERWVSGGACVECQAIRRRNQQKRLCEEEPERMKALKEAHYERRKEHIKARVRQYAQDNLEQVRQRAREYAAAHREEARMRTIEWSRANPERRKQTNAEFYKNNRGAVTAYKAKYRAARRRACPPWVDDEHFAKIREIYCEAERMSKLMNEPYHVDHIVPLQGKTVCGLHVWWNLRVIRGTDNNRRRRIWNDDGTL